MDTVRLMSIEANIGRLRRRLIEAAERAGRSPEEVKIVGATKMVPMAAIRAAIELGIRDFGENYVQEAMPKIRELSTLGYRPTWHMIGHLQRNKVKLALEFFDIIQTVDSLRLAEAISRHATRRLPVLLEVNVSGEATKSGFLVEEVAAAANVIVRLPGIDLQGLMTVAPLVSDPEEVRPIFRRLRQLGGELGLRELSMGMTDDFEVAIEEGATMIRIGRAIFGERG